MLPPRLFILGFSRFPVRSDYIFTLPDQQQGPGTREEFH
jgi:hypothetical protein